MTEIPDFWRCFHCDFHTTSRMQAEAHFGDRDDAEEFKPICKWWSNMDEAERRAQFQAIIQQLNEVMAENDLLTANRPEIVQADQETRMNIGDSGAEEGT